MKDLETVLKSCDAHFDKDRNCRKCAYNRITCVYCFEFLVRDLRDHAERLNKENRKLKEENRKLEERNKLLNKIVNETVNLCNNLFEENEKLEKQIDQIEK